MRRILLSAGEASGDRLGAGLARAIRAAAPDVELVGMGGDEMAEAGVRLVQHASEVAVVGIVEVVRHLPAIKRAMDRMTRVLTEEKPDLFVPIDFPDFNFRLAARAKKANRGICRFEVHSDGHALHQHRHEVLALAEDFVLGSLFGHSYSRPVEDAFAAPPPLGLRMPLAAGFGQSLRR